MYNQFSDANHSVKSENKNLIKNIKTTENKHEKSKVQEYRQRAISKREDKRDPSPVMMINASKPTKKMPSYKPQPKLCAHGTQGVQQTLATEA